MVDLVGLKMDWAKIGNYPIRPYPIWVKYEGKNAYVSIPKY